MNSKTNKTIRAGVSSLVLFFSGGSLRVFQVPHLGKVMDNKVEEPLIGVSVAMLDTSLEIATGLNGNFQPRGRARMSLFNSIGRICDFLNDPILCVIKTIFMLRKTVLLTIIGMEILCSCSQDETNSIYLPKEIKTEAKAMQIDTIGFFEELIYARDFWVYQDSILIVQNRKYDDVYFLEFYNLNNQKLLRQFFRLGNGHHEMLSANINLNVNMLTVVDFVKDQVAFLNVDSVLQNPLYRVTPKRYYVHAPTVALYKRNQYLIANPHCFKDEKLGIDNKTPRSIVNDSENNYIERCTYDYYTWNVAANGNIVTNYQKNRIISLHCIGRRSKSITIACIC